MTWLSIAFASALLSALAAVLQKEILRSLDAVSFSFIMSGFVLVVSAFIPLIVNVAAVTPLSLIVLIVKGIINALAFVFVMMMLERSDISGTLPLMGLTPGVTAVIAFVAIGESISSVEIAGLIVMTAGVFVIERKESIRDIRRSHVTWYIAGALGLFAVSAVMDKLLVSGYRVDPLVVLFYQHIIFFIVFGIIFASRRNSFLSVFTRARFHILALVMLVAVLTIGYRFAQLEAVRSGPVALVLAVKRTSILFAALAGGRIFKEERLIPRVAGAALIIAAGFLILRNVG